MELLVAGSQRWNLYQLLMPAVFAAFPELYAVAESPLDHLLECLLESLLQSLFECSFERLGESLHERASHREESDFPWESFTQQLIHSLWKVLQIDGSKFVEGSMLIMTEPTYLSKCFWYYDHHYEYHRDGHHHPGCHHHQPHSKGAQIPKSWCVLGSYICRTIWVGDQLFPALNCVFLLQYLRFQLSTPGP